MHNGNQMHAPSYVGSMRMLGQALQESGKYLTKDPHAATLFLVPALPYCIRGSKNLTYSGLPGLKPNQPIPLSEVG